MGRTSRSWSLRIRDGGAAADECVSNCTFVDVLLVVQQYRIFDTPAGFYEIRQAPDRWQLRVHWCCSAQRAFASGVVSASGMWGHAAGIILDLLILRLPSIPLICSLL